MTLSNDSMEGKWSDYILSKMCEEDGLSSNVTDRILIATKLSHRLVDGFGLCLSEEKDLLSQWRGYADDAYGVSIGFSETYLNKCVSLEHQKSVAAKLEKVEYRMEAQKELLRPLYEEFKTYVSQGGFGLKGVVSLLDRRSEEQVKLDDNYIDELEVKLFTPTLIYGLKKYLVKNPAFVEEREWRLFSIIPQVSSSDYNFRASRDRIVPYREIELVEAEEQSIEDIILGPRNITPESVVKSMLEKRGFGDVEVSRSEATYR